MAQPIPAPAREVAHDGENSPSGAPPPKEVLLRLRPLGPAEVLDASLTLYLRAATVFLSLAALAIGAASVVRFGLLALMTVAGTSPLDNPANGSWWGLVDWITGYVGIGVAVALSTRAGLRVWWLEEPSVGEILHDRSRAGRTAAVMGVFAIPWVPVAVVAILLAGVTSDADVLGVLLGTLLVPLALLASLFLSLGLIVVTAEDRSVWAALRRSTHLMGSTAWIRASLTYLLASLLICIIGFAVLLGADLLRDVLPFSEVSLPGVAIDTVATLIPYTIVTPLLALIPVSVYFDSRIRREGLDIELLLRAETNAPRTGRRHLVPERT